MCAWSEVPDKDLKKEVFRLHDEVFELKRENDKLQTDIWKLSTNHRLLIEDLKSEALKAAASENPSLIIDMILSIPTPPATDFTSKYAKVPEEARSVLQPPDPVREEEETNSSAAAVAAVAASSVPPSPSWTHPDSDSETEDESSYSKFTTCALSGFKRPSRHLRGMRQQDTYDEDDDDWDDSDSKLQDASFQDSYTNNTTSDSDYVGEDEEGGEYHNRDDSEEEELEETNERAVTTSTPASHSTSPPARKKPRTDGWTEYDIELARSLFGSDLPASPPPPPPQVPQNGGDTNAEDFVYTGVPVSAIEDDNDDEDVMIIDAPKPKTSPKLIEETVVDEESGLAITSHAIGILAELPHARFNCPVNKFNFPSEAKVQGTQAHKDIMDVNKVICKYCYCAICDRLASECTKWAVSYLFLDSYVNHCHSEKGRVLKKNINKPVPVVSRPSSSSSGSGFVVNRPSAPTPAGPSSANNGSINDRIDKCIQDKHHILMIMIISGHLPKRLPTKKYYLEHVLLRGHSIFSDKLHLLLDTDSAWQRFSIMEMVFMRFFDHPTNSQFKLIMGKAKNKCGANPKASGLSRMIIETAILYTKGLQGSSKKLIARWCIACLIYLRDSSALFAFTFTFNMFDKNNRKILDEIIESMFDPSSTWVRKHIKDWNFDIRETLGSFKREYERHDSPRYSDQFDQLPFSDPIPKAPWM